MPYPTNVQTTRTIDAATCGVRDCRRGRVQRFVPATSSPYVSGTPMRPLATGTVKCASTDDRTMRTSPTRASSGYVRNPPKTPKITTFATAYKQKNAATDSTAKENTFTASGHASSNATTNRASAQKPATNHRSV